MFERTLYGPKHNFVLTEQTVGDRSGEAGTLNNIGLVYDALGEKTKTLEYYNQALPISRAVGNRVGETTILNNIDRLKDK